MEAHPDTTTQAGQILASASGGKRRPGDRIFSNAAVIASVTVLALLAGVAIFLIADSVPAITANTADLPDGKNLVDYIAPLAFGTILAAAVAVVLAVPLAVAVALFISHIAPRRLANPLAYIVDLLAAIPSIVYGLWGIFVLGPAMVPILDWLVGHLSFIPFFAGPGIGHRAHHADGRPRARRDDPADRLGGRTRGLLADAAAARGGSSRTRRHPLGDDPHVGPAVRQVGGDQRLDARPRPRPGRDDGGDDHPLGLGDRHLQPGQPGEPDADRGEHRPQVPRVLGRRRQRPDRLRASSSSASPWWSTCSPG